jgi:hypothetical protein
MKLIFIEGKKMLDTLNLDGSLLWATALTIVQLVGLAK